VSADGEGLADARAAFARYLADHPAEARGLDELRIRLRDDAAALQRSNMHGHVTTSALVLDATLTHALFVHHRALGRWLQPGGHYEPPGSLWDSACREVAEETGVRRLAAFGSGAVPPLLLDVDSHDIPPRPAKGEGAHRHHDFAYLAVAPLGATRAVADGSARRLDADARGAARPGDGNATFVPTPQLDEVLAVRWIPLAELAAFPLARTRRLARKAQEAIARHLGARRDMPAPDVPGA